MSRMSAPETPLASQHLTKSRYIAGLQCPRRLWLVVHEPLPYEDPAPGSPMDIGQEIGSKAHLLFPGGVLVTEEPWQHAEAVARTAALDGRCARSRDLRGGFRARRHPHPGGRDGTPRARRLGPA